MYNDPSLIKKHTIKVRVDDYLNQQINMLVGLTGAQKAVAVRQLIEIGLEQVHKANSIGVVPLQEGLLESLNQVA